ncbi:hypothetical protein [Streptomyces sp. NRRL S-448]|uniref:hypothetical protein n=1 Tax=Streptomyces sp. NRRL S-448 TaxID=1463907 RepID=UPI0035664D02
MDGLGDRAYVFADGTPLGILDRNAPDEGLDLPVGEAGVTLDLLVRAQGRANYGPLLDDRKGIWRGIRHGHQQRFESVGDQAAAADRPHRTRPHRTRRRAAPGGARPARLPPLHPRPRDARPHRRLRRHVPAGGPGCSA